METVSWRREWRWEGLPVLVCEAGLPRFAGQEKAQRRMERYWRHWERCLLGWLEGYHGRCSRRAAALLERSRPIPLEQVQVRTKELWTGEGLVSLLVEVESSAGVWRDASLWRLSDGTPVEVGRLLTPWQRLRFRGGTLAATEGGVVCITGRGQGRWAVQGEKYRRKRKRAAG